MSDDPRRWDRVKAVLHAALAEAPELRGRFLAATCGDDIALRREVESLLAAHEQAGSFAENSRGIQAASLLAPNSRFGRYQVLHKIDSGGMGEVYRAHDPSLGRDVALKVLPRELAGDPDRAARLEREARLLAALNHPHIATVHGFEESGDTRAIVMELVEGPTLRERLALGQLRLEEALRIAAQIADALAAAHDKGIVHRDLKPENITLTASRGVKVLDFGLAKPVALAGVDVVKGLTMPSTLEGVLAGTPAYMSPEQARGQRVDNRTDVWAFGCVLYEMLTGRAAFPGETTADVLAHVVERDPGWASLPAGTPAAIRRLLRRCLEKTPERRVHDARHVQLEIDDALNVLSEAPAQRVSRRRLLWMATTGTTATVMAGAAAWVFERSLRDDTAAVTRFTIQPPAMPHPFGLAVSPDGQTIAFVAAGAEGKAMLFLRPVAGFEAHILPGTAGARAPFWSPDGRTIGFDVRDEGRLKIIDIVDGEVRTLCNLSRNFVGGTWNEDGVIVFAAGPNLYRVPAKGGTPVPLIPLGRAVDETGHWWPFFLPDGRHFLHVAWHADPAKRRLVARSLDNGEPKLVMTTASMGFYTPAGFLLFTTSERRLFAQRFDASTFELSGQPIPIADDVMLERVTGRAAFSSADGTLAYRSDKPGQAQTGGADPLAPIRIVLNWTADLKL